MLSRFFSNLFSGKLWKWLTGSAGALVALFLLGKNFLDLTALQSVFLAIGVIVAIIILAFLRYLLIFLYGNRRSKYGEAIVQLKNGFAAVNKLKRSNSTDPEIILEVLVDMCNTIKLVFDRLIKCDCSVSIKIPIVNKPITDDAIVENICRDYKHYLLRNTDEYKKQQHRVTGNTAYQIILNNVLQADREHFYYLNNNVPKTKDYQTTSKPAYPGGILPYKSELVYPILPMTQVNDDEKGDKKQKYEIWGFLCLDCNYINRFNNRYHVAIIEGVADGLFDVIMKINKSRTLTV